MGDAALIKKLGLKPGHRAAVVNPPAGYLERIGPPEGVEAATRLDGSFDFVQVFALDRAALDRDIGAAHGALAPGGRLWVSYPKGSSKVPTDLSRELGPLGEAIGNLFAELGKPENQRSIREFIHGFMAVATWIIGTGIPWLIKFSRAIKGVSDWFSNLDDVVERTGKATRAAFERWFGAIAAFFADWWAGVKRRWNESLTATREALVAWAGVVAGWFRRTLTAIEDAVQGWASDIRRRWSEALSKTIEALTSWATRTRARFTEALSKAKETVTDGLSAIVRFFSQFPGRAWSALSQLASRLRSRATEGLNAFWRAAQDRWNVIRTWIAGLPEKIRLALGAIGSKLRSSGSALISGLLDGVRSRISEIGGLGSWFKANLIDPVVNAVKRFFGISSPSTVFAGIGADLIRGLWEGVARTDSKAMVTRIFGGMPQALASIVNKGLISLSNLPTKALEALGTLGGAISGAISGILGTFTGAKGPIVDLMRSMAAAVGWTGGQWNALYRLIMGESGFNPNAQNPTSTAYGLFQFLDSTWASVGARKTSDPVAQIQAGFRYIAGRYGTPASAWAAWSSRSPHWYHEGGPILEDMLAVGNRTGRLYGFQAGEQVLSRSTTIAHQGQVVNNYNISLDMSRVRDVERAVAIIKGVKSAARAGPRSRAA